MTQSGNELNVEAVVMEEQLRIVQTVETEEAVEAECSWEQADDDDEDDPDNQEERDITTNTNGPPDKQTLLRPSSPNRPTAVTITASTRTTTTTTTQPTPNRSSTSTSKSHCTPLGPSSSSATATGHKPTPPTVSTAASSPLEQQSSPPETLGLLDNSLLQLHYTPPTTPPRQAPQVPVSPHLRQFNLVPQDARDDNVVAPNDPCCGAACLGYGTSSNSKNNKNKKKDPNTDTPALVASWKTPTTTPNRSLPPQSPPSDDTGAPTTRTVVSTTKSLPSTPQKSLWQTARSSPTSPILGSRPRQSRSSPSSPATTNKASTNQETTPPNDDPHVIRLPVSLLERASLHQHSDNTVSEATAALKEVARRLSQHEQLHASAAQSSPAPQQQGHETENAPQQLPPADSTPDCCYYATVLEEPQPAAPVRTTTTNSTQGLSPRRPDPAEQPEQPQPEQPEALTAMEQLLDCMAEWTHEDTTQDDDTEQAYDWTLHHQTQLRLQLTQPDPPRNDGPQPPPDPPMSDNRPQQEEEEDEDLTAYFNEETIRHHQQEAAALQEQHHLPHHPDFDSDDDTEPQRTPSKPPLSSCWQSNPPLAAASPGSLPPVWEGEGPEDEEEEHDTRDNNEEAWIPLSPQEQEHTQALEALLQQANHHDDKQEMPLSVSAPILTSHTTFHGSFFTHVLQEDDDDDDDENETSSSSSFPTTNGSDSDMILLDDDMEEEDEDNHSSTSSSTHFSIHQVLDGSSSTPNTRSTSVVQEHTQVVVTQPWVIPQEPDDEEASCSQAQDEEDEDTHSMEAQPDWSRPDQQPPPHQETSVGMSGKEKKSTVDGDAVSTTTATTVASTAVASSILDQLGRDGGSTPSPLLLTATTTTTTTTTQTLDLDRMGTEEKKEDDRPVSGQCSSPQEKKKTEEEHEPTTVLTNGVVLPIKDQLTQPNGSSGAMGVMSEVVQHWQSMVGSPPTNESTTNGSMMKAEKDENPSALEVNPSVTEETQCTPPRTKPTLTLSTPEQDVLSSSPYDDLKLIPLTNTTPPRSSSKSVTSGAFSEESFTLATNFVTTPQRPVVEAEVDCVLEDVAKENASPPRVVKAHEYPAEDDNDEKNDVDNDDDEAKGHSRTSSMQTEYNSSKAPTTNDGMVEDIQQMGETMFVASSPPSSPMSAKRQEALEESNNRKGEDDESDVYTSSSSEDDSTLTQAGSMSSSGTLSSTSSAGQTTAAAALGANSSLLCPVKEGEEEEHEADELLFSSLSNSSLDKASEHELVQPSVVDRRMNSLVRQEHLNVKDLKVVVIQALVRGYLVRIQKPVDTETLQHEGAQDERRKSKLGRFVPKSLKLMRPRSPKSRRESKEVTPDKSPRSTSPGGRQRRLGSLVRRSAGGLFRRSNVWVSSNSLSPKREKSVENTKSLEPRQEVDHTNGESETEVDVKIEEESNAFALDKDSKATRLQAFVRLHLVQSMVRRQKRAAVLIQKCWRQHVLMQRIAAAKTICRVMSLHHRRRLADMERQRKEQDAVRVLQQAWKRHLSAKNRRENAAAETLQRAFSLYHEKCTMERRQNRAALTIQRVLAAFRTRRGQEKRCEHAALVIQRTFSWYRAKCIRIARRRDEAARILQCVWRQYRKEEAAKIVIQRSLICYHECLKRERTMLKEAAATQVICRVLSSYHSQLVSKKRVREMKAQQQVATRAIQLSWRRYRENKYALVIQRALIRHRALVILERRIRKPKDRAATIIQKCWRTYQEEQSKRTDFQRELVRYHARYMRRYRREQIQKKRESAACIIERAFYCHQARCIFLILQKEALRKSMAARTIQRALRLYVWPMCVLRKEREALLAREKASQTIHRFVVYHHIRRCAALRQQREEHASLVILRSLSKHHAMCVSKRNREALHRQLIKSADVIERAWRVCSAKRELEAKKEQRRLEDRRHNASRTIVGAMSNYRVKCIAERKLAHASRVISRSLSLFHARCIAERNAVALRNQRMASANAISRTWLTYRSKQELKRMRLHRVRSEASKIISRAMRSYHAKCVLERKIEQRRESQSEEKKQPDLNSVALRRNRMNSSAAVIQRAWAAYRARFVARMRRRAMALRKRRTEVVTSNESKSQPKANAQEKNAFTRRRARMAGAATAIQRAWALYREKCVIENNLKKQRAVVRQRDRVIGAVKVVQRAWLVYRAKCTVELRRQERDAISRHQNRLHAAARCIQETWASYLLKCRQERERKRAEIKASRIIVSVMKQYCEKCRLVRKQMSSASLIGMAWLVYRAKCLVQQKKLERADRARITISRAILRYRSRCIFEHEMESASIIQCAWLVYVAKCEMDQRQKERLHFASRTIQRALVRFRAECVLEQKIVLRRQQLLRESLAAQTICRVLERNRVKTVTKRNLRIMAASVIVWRALSCHRFRCAVAKKIKARQEENERSAAAVVIQRAFHQSRTVFEDPAIGDKVSGSLFTRWTVLLLMISWSIAATILFVKPQDKIVDSSRNATWAGMHHHEHTVFGHGKHRHAALGHFERRYLEDHEHVKPSSSPSTEPPVPMSAHPSGQRNDKRSSESKHASIERTSSKMSRSTRPHTSPVVSTKTSNAPISSEPSSSSVRDFTAPPYLQSFLQSQSDESLSATKEAGHDATWAGMHHHEHPVYGHGKHRHTALHHFENRYMEDHQFDRSSSIASKDDPVSESTNDSADKSQLHGSGPFSAVSEWEWLASRVKKQNNES